MAGERRKISETTEFVIKKCKKQPFTKKRATKKKRAEKGHVEKMALEKKKGTTK